MVWGCRRVGCPFGDNDGRVDPSVGPEGTVKRGALSQLEPLTVIDHRQRWGVWDRGGGGEMRSRVGDGGGMTIL